MASKKNAGLPVTVAEALTRLGKQIEAGAVSRADIAGVIAQLDALPPRTVPMADAEVANLANLFRGQRRLSLLGNGAASRKHLELLDRHRELAPIFLFHRDGYVREAALAGLASPPASPFFVAVIAWRLNDWVRAVRITARHYAERALPETSAATLAGAAPFLLDRWRRWGRWDEENAAVVDRALQQADVAPYLVEWFSQGSTGPLATLLRYALRGSSLDEYLPLLSQRSVQPSVRAVALQTLLRRKASWPVGVGLEWVDKSFGLSRRVTLFAHRQVESRDTVETLISCGLQDRSAVVRRVAADALIEQRAAFPQLDTAIARLLADKSPGLRERAEFLLRMRVEEAVDRE